MDVEIDERYADWATQLPPGVSDKVFAAIAAHPGELTDVVIALDDHGRPVGHAALRDRGDALEVKKVYVLGEARGQGISKTLMLELESIAREKGAQRLVLQTGPLQPEAVGLYEAIGYYEIDPYGGYDVIPGVRCFAKDLRAAK